MARLGGLVGRRTASTNSGPPLSGMEGILAEFKDYYKSSVDQIIIDERKREERLRVSSFPYCGLRHSYERMTKHEKPPAANFGSFYYTEVGTAAHEVIQDFMGRKGKIYGVWICTAPGCKGKRKFSAKNTCPLCKSRMRYEELTVKAFKNVSGHLDGIYRDSKGRYWLVDYKTSSVQVITTQKKNPTLPYHHNVHQIKAYCALIELMFDIEISGWILMYVARDNPMIFSKPVGEFMSAKAKARELKKIKRYDRDWTRVVNMFKFEDLLAVIKDKPCEDYDDYMHKFGDSMNPCPLAVSGVCFQKKKLKNLMQIVWDDRPAEFRLG